MRILKQNTAVNVMVLMTNSADHVAGQTGLTLTITLSKDGGAFAAITPTVTERGSGWYNLAFTAAHTDTLGDLAVHITAAGADPTDFACSVFTQTFNDLVVAPTAAQNATAVRTELTTELGRVDVAISTRLAAAGYTAPDNTNIGLIKAKTDNLPASPANEVTLGSTATKVDRLHRARGLEVGTPATNTLTKLTAGDIDVDITGDLETTTTYSANT